MNFLPTTIITLTMFFPLYCTAQYSSGFMPEICRVPTETEKTKWNGITKIEECGRKRGEWHEFYSEDKWQGYCVVPYEDGGKLCKSSKDCKGHCIWPNSETMPNGKPLPKGYGICQTDDNVEDCGRAQIENGVISCFSCDEDDNDQ